MEDNLASEVDGYVPDILFKNDLHATGKRCGWAITA